MRPLKICFLGWGDHVHLERWAGFFARRGHSVSVVSTGGMGSYPAEVAQFMLGFRKRGLIWKRLQLAHLLWRIKPDLLHVHWAHFASLVPGRWRRPLVVTAWGSDIYRPEAFNSAEASRLRENLLRAAAITCDSQDLADRVAALIGRRHGISVIQWGIDTGVFRPGAPDTEFRGSLAEPGRPVVLSIRNFTPLYNLERVVGAFARVLKEMPDALLLMKKYKTGQPDYVKSIEERIASLGIARAVRIVEDIPYERMPDLYRLAQVTVSVPSTDATPMSLLEAMACGSVPIFTDLPSLREWIRDGYNGYLVGPADEDRLAQCILRVLRSPQLAQEFSRRNFEIVRERADQSVSMQSVEDIYQRLAAPARGTHELHP